MRGREAGSPRRSWLVWLGLLGTLLLALQAGRSAVVAALGERKPALAHAVWAAHPVPQDDACAGRHRNGGARGEATALPRPWR